MRRSILRSFLCIILVTLKSFSAVSIDSTTINGFIRGVALVDSSRFDEGLRIFHGISDNYTEHPIGYFGMAATYQTMMRNYRTNCFEAEYDSLLNLAVVIGEKAVRENRQDALSRFYLGGAYGFRGLYKVRTREWFGAFADGLKGLIALERSLELDPTLYDAYYGLGIYHYWRSAKTDILGPVSPFKKGKKRGINEMWRAIRFGRYSEVSGMYALVATYYDYGEMEKAWAINEELHRRYPDNPSCLYMRTRLCQAMENWEEMLRAVKHLHEHLEQVGYGIIGYTVECLYLRAFAEAKLGRLDDTKLSIDRAISLAPQRDADREIEGPLEDFEDIFNAIKTLKETL